jgi:hypothetical protein
MSDAEQSRIADTLDLHVLAAAYARKRRQADNDDPWRWRDGQKVRGLVGPVIAPKPLRSTDGDIMGSQARLLIEETQTGPYKQPVQIHGSRVLEKMRGRTVRIDGAVQMLRDRLGQSWPLLNAERVTLVEDEATPDHGIPSEGGP